MTKKQTPKPTRRKKVSTRSAQPTASVGKVGKPMPGDLTHEEVARRAHQVWLNNGCQPNCDLQNWHEAEKRLHDERNPRRELAADDSTEKISSGGGTFAGSFLVLKGRTQHRRRTQGM